MCSEKALVLKLDINKDDNTLKKLEDVDMSRYWNFVFAVFIAWSGIGVSLAQDKIESNQLASNENGSGGVVEMPADGSARWDVPITIPTGVDGFAPDLDLNYNSRYGNGVVGVGWTTFSSSIVRQNAAGGISYSGDNYDFVHRGGAGKLINLGSNTVFEGSVEYREEVIFGQFKRYFLVTDTSGRDYWKVLLPDGSVWEYGNAIDSVEGVGFENIPTVKQYRWRISKMTDSNGNVCDFGYTKDGDSEFLYLDQINYGPCRIKFQYSDRDDPTVDRAAGFILDVRKRVDRIESFVREEWMAEMKATPESVDGGSPLEYSAVDGYVSSLAYDLEFDYSEETGRSLLSMVNSIGRNGTISPVWYGFDYSDRGATEGEYRSYLMTSSYSGVWIPIDHDGDGHRSFFFFTNHAYSIYPSRWEEGTYHSGEFLDHDGLPYSFQNSMGWLYKLLPGDYNGDGLEDIFHIRGEDDAYLLLSNGDGTFQPCPVYGNFAFSNNINNGRIGQMVSDFDNDGVDEIVAWGSPENGGSLSGS